ncbi:conjugal transfer protein TraG [Ralstonia pickettii]|uniref:type IV secretory system conjugative DNA transfer family protein n=1 Tax=Ralstonia pickettii TaxID=329 RepID=UPI000BD56A98|nr:type IV secretory system conjugative DNA transfer family protein [Ralstonia pickettii]MBT2180868.1 type IV secretory system conjugative DNA transfer family protein [Ralstonia pickettii]POH90076.1 conjugal transfer protein TraG [Ralstonia pickettii]
MKQRNNAVGPLARGRKKARIKAIPLAAAASMVAGLQGATQWFAHTFNYQAALGSHVGPVYAPWAIVSWWLKWHDAYGGYLQQAGSVGGLIASGGLIAALLTANMRANSATPSEFLHGSARWADQKDIEEAGLLGKDAGVYVGAWVDAGGVLRYLRHNGPEHVLTAAPTRSGKGVGLVVPTLLSWPHSAVITDLKGELWAMTAGWRKKYARNKVIRFEPAALDCGAAWNALDEIRLGTEAEVGDVQNLASLIVDPDGKGLQSHWDKTAFALLTGVILHALYKAKHEGGVASMASVDLMLSDPDRDVRELWVEMTQYGHVNGENHPAVGSAGRDMLDRPDEEAGSVLSTAKSFLSLYRDPVVARNTSMSNFKVKDLMNSDDPVSLYIVTQPNDKTRLRPLVRILVNMIVRLNADKMEFERVIGKAPWWRKLLAKVGIGQPMKAYVRTKKTYKHRLLGMFDEFPSLGKLEIMQESLAFVAGYGIKFYLICQDINQLRSREIGYGPDETISSNCHVQNAYPPNRTETADHLSKLSGITTVVKQQVTESGKRFGAVMGQASRTLQEVQRPLLTADECLRMPGPKKDGELIVEAGDMLVSVAGYPMIYGRQPLFFQDPIFSDRAAVPPPEKCDILRFVTTPTPVTL